MEQNGYEPPGRLTSLGPEGAQRHSGWRRQKNREANGLFLDFGYPIGWKASRSTRKAIDLQVGLTPTSRGRVLGVPLTSLPDGRCSIEVEREAARPRSLEPRAELHGRDQVIAAILSPVRNGRGGCKHAHPLTQACGNRRKSGSVEPVGPIDYEGRKHVVARVIENAVIDGEQQVIDRPVDAAVGIVLPPAAGRHEQHRPLALQVPSP